MVQIEHLVRLVLYERRAKGPPLPRSDDARGDGECTEMERDSTGCTSPPRDLQQSVGSALQRVLHQDAVAHMHARLLKCKYTIRLGFAPRDVATGLLAAEVERAHVGQGRLFHAHHPLDVRRLDR